jgi:trimethylamine--corrinoid protein Co-methyltransferase
MTETGPGGNFLTSRHTLENFRSELWFPRISNRLNFTAWQAAGSPTTGQKLGHKVREILDGHRPRPLEEKVATRLKAMAEA